MSDKESRTFEDYWKATVEHGRQLAEEAEAASEAEGTELDDAQAEKETVKKRKRKRLSI